MRLSHMGIFLVLQILAQPRSKKDLIYTISSLSKEYYIIVMLSFYFLRSKKMYYKKQRIPICSLFIFYMKKVNLDES